MNNDLISRSALLEKVHWVAGEGTSGRVYVSDINEAPAVDAESVRYGRWIVDECDTSDDVPSYSWIDFHCSECNTDYGLEEGQYGWCRYEKIPYNYCPSCGAKMDGGK
jgi:hypothetical protein